MRNGIGDGVDVLVGHRRRQSKQAVGAGEDPGSIQLPPERLEVDRLANLEERAVAADRDSGSGQPVSQIRSTSVEVLDAITIEVLERNETSRHRDRVCAERSSPADVAVSEGIEHSHDLSPATDCSDRESAADDLAEGYEIWINAVLPVQAGKRKTEGDDLVDDQQHAAGARRRADMLHEVAVGGLETCTVGIRSTMT